VPWLAEGRSSCALEEEEEGACAHQLKEEERERWLWRLGVGSGKFFQLARGGLIFIDMARVRVFSWAKWAGLEWAWPKTRTRVALYYFSE
jgi:hypothetical protein